MLRTQKKLSEVSLPQEALSSSDKVVLRYAQSRDWFTENRTTVYVFFGVIAAAMVGLYLYRENQIADNERANVLLSRITPAYISGEYRQAIDGDKNRQIQGDQLFGLRYITNEYGSTEAGNRARLFLANGYYYLGLPDSALAEFEDAESTDPVLQASIDGGKAAILEEKGNKEEAAKLFERAAKHDKTNPLNADYLLAAARNLEQVKKNDEAIKLYRALLEDYPGTQFDDAAKRALMKMNVPL